MRAAFKPESDQVSDGEIIEIEVGPRDRNYD